MPGGTVRIAVVGLRDRGGGSLSESFVRGARVLGHDAELVDVPSLVSGTGVLIRARRLGLENLLARRQLDRLRRQLASLAPQVVVVVKGRFLPRGWLERVRTALACPIVNYHPDHPLWPGFEEEAATDALAAYDELVVWADDVADALRGRGLPHVRVVPFGFDPDVYAPPNAPVERLWDAALVGQHYRQREEVAAALADLRLFVSGRGWDGALGGVASTRTYSGPDTCRIYWSSAVGLNIVGDWNRPNHNMRTFEIPASGTAMVASRTPFHERLFADGGAVLVDGAREARAAVLHLLSDDDERAAVASRGRACVEPCTYTARMDELIAPWTTV